MNVHVESNFVGAWFLLSTRLAVYRVCNVQFCNGSYRHKLVDLVQRMNDLFERPCLIVELNREQQQRNFLETRDHRTKYVDMIMVQLAQSNVRVLFSQDQTESAKIMATMANKGNIEFTPSMVLGIFREREGGGGVEQQSLFRHCLTKGEHFFKCYFENL